MNATQIMETEEFKRCKAFHGHLCPGLCIGFKAATTAMDIVKTSRAEDEEIVAIVETDACSADAVQVLTGCTFGKGNFIYRDYGKMALTLFSRESGKGVRVSLRPGAFSPDETHFALLRKVLSGEASENERKQFQNLHLERSHDVLEMSSDELFVIKPVLAEIPAKAEIQPSQPCERCGEPTMRSKLQASESGWICRGCFDRSGV
jgi:formylmethanofuran dehydrogenase subunit E